jgi:adenosylhomocysteinase
MDMSFANQALAAEYGAKNHASLSPTVHVMPDEIDREVARLKLEALNIAIDKMTPEQERYVKSWQEGT